MKSKYIWKHDTFKDVIMVYGFINSSKFYDAVLTLHRKRGGTWVHGFLSKKPLEISDFVNLFRYLRLLVKTKFTYFEVLPEHYRLYKNVLTIDSVKDVKTFDGFNAYELKLDLKKEHKNPMLKKRKIK